MNAPLQEQPAQPTDEEINARFAALAAQREQASNQVVLLTGEAARLRGIIAGLETVNAVLRANAETPDGGGEE